MRKYYLNTLPVEGMSKKFSVQDLFINNTEAGIIIGSGSASFEIIRDLVENMACNDCSRWA